MSKEDWIRKLCSRKFWAAVAGFVTGLVAFIASPSGSQESLGGLIMTFGMLVAYIVGEGLADAAGAQADIVYNPQEEEKPPEIDG